MKKQTGFAPHFPQPSILVCSRYFKIIVSSSSENISTLKSAQFLEELFWKREQLITQQGTSAQVLVFIF